MRTQRRIKKMVEVNNFSFKDYFNEGDIIKGFCNGYFGRDDYNNKEVISVHKDRVIFKYCDETNLKNELEWFEITEYNLLQLSNIINYNKNTEESYLIKTHEEFKKMFEEWNNG